MSTLSARRRRGRLRASVSAVVALTLLAACGGGGGGDDSEADSAMSADSAADSAANADGKITLGSMFPPGTLDPTVGTQGSDLHYLDFVFDRLIDRNPDTGALEPMLATSWEFVGEDRLKLELKLREDVTFHDGTPFNAEAVVSYSEKFIEAGNIANLLQYVTEVTADDEYTVTYHLSQQNARLPSGLTARAGMIPSPTAMEEAGDEFAAHPVGTGPYEFVSQVQGANYKFTRFDEYWNDDELERVKDVEFKMFQSDTSLANAIRGGEVNAALQVAPQNAATLEPLDNLDVSVGPSPAIGIAYLDASKKPLDDERVRLALNLALDREAIAEAVTDGLGHPATQSLPADTHGYIDDMEPLWEQDVDQAKQLMEDAGYAEGVDLTCYEYPGLGFGIAGPIMISQWKEIGVNLEITPSTPAQVGPFFEGEAEPQCTLANWGATDTLKAYQLLWSESYYNAGKVDFGIDDDISDFYSTYTEDGEVDIIRSILETVQSSPGYVPIFRAPLVDVYQSNIGGWQTTNLGDRNWRGLHYTN